MENHSSASALALLGCLESWKVGMMECWNAVKVLWRVANSCTMQCQLDAKTRSSFRRCDGWAMSHSQHIFAPSFFLKKTVTVTCFFRLLIDCTVPSTTIYVRPSRRIVGIFFYVEHSVANDEHEPKHCSRHVINKEYTDPLKRYIERILFHLGPLMVGLFEAMHLYMKAIPKFGPSF